MIEWPEPLIIDLARRRTIPVIGSGVSKHSENESGVRPPLWKEFLYNCAQTKSRSEVEHIFQAIEDRDYLHACEWLKMLMEDEWNNYLRDTFTAPQFRAAEIHKQLANLDSRIVFSLNFDNIFETYLRNEQGGSTIVKNYHDSDVQEFLRDTARFVIKLHGSLDTPNKLIFTQRDYADARINNAAFYKALDASILTHSLLFIGAGYTDPDVNLLLENHNFTFPSAKPHYFLTSENHHECLVRSMKENRNLKFIVYDKIDDGHSGLVTELENLVKQTNEAREDLIQTTNW